MIRNYISRNGKEWEGIIHHPDFEKHFTVQGTTLKNVPAGYEKEHPQADYLKFKSWYLEYPLKDEEVEIAKKMHDPEVIVFATPIYYYEMSGQMKTMLDRANSLYGTDYAFEDIYMLSTAAEDAEGVDARAVSGLEGWIECFERARLAGTVFAGGVNGIGEIEGHPALEQAFEMGKAV